MFRDYEIDRSMDEIYVYDQSCDNCHNPDCPMRLPQTAEEYMEEFGTLSGFDEEAAEQETNEILQRREEDAVIRGSNPTWCIYWQGRSRRGRG